jgi:rubrerythrin
MRKFKTLSDREVLALEISLEEEDERVYGEHAEKLGNDRSSSWKRAKNSIYICALNCRG